MDVGAGAAEGAGQGGEVALVLRVKSDCGIRVLVEEGGEAYGAVGEEDDLRC